MKLRIITALVIITLLSLSFQASAGCGKWVVRYPETDYLEDPVFDEAVKSSTGTTAGTSSADISESADQAQETSKPVISKEDAMPDFSGKWLVELQELADSSLSLILIQSGDRLQGYGNLAEKGAQIPTTATGQVSEERVFLDVKLVVDGTLNQLNKQYKIDLIQGNDALSGKYEAYVDEKLAEKGNVTASKQP